MSPAYTPTDAKLDAMAAKLDAVLAALCSRESLSAQAKREGVSVSTLCRRRKRARLVALANPFSRNT